MRGFSVPHAKDGDNSDPDPELPNITDEEWPIEVYDGEIEEDLDRFVSIKDAERIIGGLSSASKMPGATFSLPASACRNGSRQKDDPNLVRHMPDPLKKYHNKIGKLLGRHIQGTLILYFEVGSRIRSILWRRASPEQEQARLTTRRLACIRSPLTPPPIPRKRSFVLLSRIRRVSRTESDQSASFGRFSDLALPHSPYQSALLPRGRSERQLPVGFGARGIGHFQQQRGLPGLFEFPDNDAC